MKIKYWCEPVSLPLMNHTHLPNSVIGVILQRVCDHKELDDWIKSDHGNELHGSISMIKIERETTQRMKKTCSWFTFFDGSDACFEFEDCYKTMRLWRLQGMWPRNSNDWRMWSSSVTLGSDPMKIGWNIQHTLVDIFLRALIKMLSHSLKSDKWRFAQLWTWKQLHHQTDTRDTRLSQYSHGESGRQVVLHEKGSAAAQHLG